MNYNFEGIPKIDYNFEGIPKAVQTQPTPIEEPEGLLKGFVKPTLEDIGGGFKEVGKDLAQGVNPLETVSQTVKGLGIGMLGFGDMVYSRMMNAGQQLIGKGEIDPEAVRIAGEARQKLYEFEVTDPGAKTITGMVGSVPTGVKLFFENLAEPFKESSPNVYAGLKTLGDLGELAAFGEVFKALKMREAPDKVQTAEPLDATYAKNEVLKRMAKEKAGTKQRPLDTLARKEESLKAKPPEPTARDLKQVELEETFKDYNFEGLEKAKPKEATPEKAPEAKKIYRQGGEDGKWWTPDKEYADSFGKKGAKVISKEIPSGTKLIDESKLTKQMTPGERSNIKGESMDGYDQAIKRLGYDGMTRLEDTMEGTQYKSHYFPKEAKPPEVAKAKRPKFNFDGLEKAKPKKSTKGANVRTLRGAIKNIGGINFLNFKGELRDMSTAVKYLSRAKSGIPIDDVVRQLVDDGWLDKGTDVPKFLEKLRTNPKILSRDRVGRDIGEKKTHELTEQEKQFKKESEWRPEEPPMGEYKTIRAEDLPEGKKVTLIDNKTSRGWDVYEITEKDPFSITLVDGETIELKPNDKVQILKKDVVGSIEETTKDRQGRLLAEEVKKKLKKKSTEIIDPNGSYVDWKNIKKTKQDGMEGTYYATFHKDGSFKSWKTKTDIEKIKRAGGKPTLNLGQDVYGKQGIKGEKTKQQGLGLVIEDPSQPGLFRSPKDIASDINTALGKRGSIEIGKLTPEQEAAITRLKGDIEGIKKEAKKVGKTVEKYLLAKNYDPQTAYLLHKYADEIPKYARSINLEKQDIPEDYKAFEATLLSSKPKKTQTWEQTEKLAEKYTKDVTSRAKLFTDAKKGKYPNNPEGHLAMRQIHVNAVEGLHRIAQMDDPKLMRQAMDSYRDNVGHVVSDTASEAGRMLNIYKKEVAINNLGKALTELEKELNKIQFEELKNLNLEDPVMIQQFIKNLKDPKLSDYFLEYWYNSILSGPPTHVVNMVGNTLWTAFQVPHRAVTAIVDKFYSKATGKQRQFYMNEVMPMLAGYGKGFKKGKATAMEVLRTGKAQKFEDKWYQELDFSMGAWRRSPNAFMRKVAPLVDVPTRALRAMDVWANAIAYDGEINSIVRRMSNEKGLKGKARAEFEKIERENITDEMHEAAKKKALNSTFMDEPDPFTQYVISARNIPVIGPVLRVTVMPFVNTISNLTKRGVELTPGLGIVKEAVSRGMGRGMPTQKLIAKQIMGSVLAFYVINKAAEGRITGPMPEGKSEREAWYRQNKKPWAMKVGGKYNPDTKEIDGGTWVQYRRFEPFNTVIAGASLAYEEIKLAMDKGDEKTATEHFGHFVDRMKENLVDGSYLSGLSAALDKYGGRKGAIPRWLASWMPYSSFFRSINRSVEVINEGSAKPRVGDDWLKAFSSVIPGLSGKMPAKLDTWGEESVIPGDVFQQWLPFKWSKETEDPIEKELERLDIYPMLPRQTVSYKNKDVKLPDDVYRKYCIDYGRLLKGNIGFRVGQENWSTRSPETRKKILERVRGKTSLKARRNLVRNYLSKGQP